MLEDKKYLLEKAICILYYYLGNNFLSDPIQDSEEAEPMKKTGHQHVHEEVPIELLGAANDSEQQFQVGYV